MSDPVPGLVFIVGKVIRVRTHEKTRYTAVICPAKDLYSRPSVVEFRSKTRFAEVGEAIKAYGDLGGYEGKSYTVVDKDSGERQSLIPVNMFLDLVE